jgi:hypothetical protein
MKEPNIMTIAYTLKHFNATLGILLRKLEEEIDERTTRNTDGWI